MTDERSTSRPTLAFITPAWLRFEVSAVCFAERAWAIDQLRALGIDATCIVVADDKNVDLAKWHGFHVIEQDNEHGLGRKFNDGYAEAAKTGIDFVCPMGSDSFIDPQFIADAVNAAHATFVTYSVPYAVVKSDGLHRIDMEVKYIGGTSMLFPTQLLRKCRYRPIRDDAPKGCDGQTVASLKRTRARFKIIPAHKLSTIGFQTEHQISNYRLLFERWGVNETDQPFEGLTQIYPVELVDDIERVYEKRRMKALV